MSFTHTHTCLPQITTLTTHSPHKPPQPNPTGTYAGGAIELGHASQTHQSPHALIRIQGFLPRVAVLPSKQRPRKLRMWGSDGRVHVFLLKGHEDLRQDERVMQLFGLVNALLASEGGMGGGSGGGVGMRIARFAVMPLSANSGLIGWVRGCDTLHQVRNGGGGDLYIRERRGLVFLGCCRLWGCGGGIRMKLPHTQFLTHQHPHQTRNTTAHPRLPPVAARAPTPGAAPAVADGARLR